MRIVSYPDSDAIYVRLQQDAQYGGGRQLDDSRHLDLDSQGNPLGILFLYVSDGVDGDAIPGISSAAMEHVLRLIAEAGIMVKMPA